MRHDSSRSLPRADNLLESRFSYGVLLSAAIALLLALAAGFGAAAQDAPPKKRCYQCKGSGLIPCTKHQPEKDAEYCTVYLAKPCCKGLDATVCPRCLGEDADIEAFKAKEADREKWLERTRKFAEDAGEELVMVQTAHYYLGYGIDEVKAGKKRYDKHAGAHLYASRVEKLYDACQKIFVDDGHPKGFKFDVHIFGTAEGCTNITQKLGGTNPGNGWKLYGQNRMVFTTFDNPGQFPDDEFFHEYVIHNTAHLLIRRFGGYSSNLPAWLDNGFASLMEYKMFEGTKVTCFTEQPPDSPWKGSEWKDKVKKEALAGNFKRFDAIAEEPLDSMDYRDHAYAYSYVDFLVSHDRAKFVALVRELQKEKPDSKAAIKKAYGWIVGELEEEWKRFASRG
jgi:hypothetical protein